MPDTDLEKGGTMTDKVCEKGPTSENNMSDNSVQHRTWTSNLGTTVLLTIAYIALYLTNYYLSPSGAGAQHRSGDSGRIPPLVVILMLLGSDIIQQTFAVTTTSVPNESPCFGFGWLAYSVGLLVPIVSQSQRLLPLEADKETTSTSAIAISILEPTGKPSPPFRTVLRNRSIATAAIQFSLACIFWCYSNDLSVLLLLSTSILLVEATANLPTQCIQTHVPRADIQQTGAYASMRDGDTRSSSSRRIFVMQPTHTSFSSVDDTPAPRGRFDSRKSALAVPVVVLTAGGFLGQALVCTQLSDAAATLVLGVMFVGTVGNVAIAACPRGDGVKIRVVGVIGGGDIAEMVKVMEERYEGGEETWVREGFHGRLGEGKDRMKVMVSGVGEMD